jgi:hypothetical protein
MFNSTVNNHKKKKKKNPTATIQISCAFYPCKEGSVELFSLKKIDVGPGLIYHCLAFRQKFRHGLVHNCRHHHDEAWFIANYLRSRTFVFSSTISFN